jgi:hypothetical protein
MPPSTPAASGINPSRTRSARNLRRKPNNSSLFVELLDTRNCLEMLPRLNDFENAVFGPDFTVTLEEMDAWANSGCWFCAAMTGEAVVGRRQILSMLSVLVTTTESRDRLMAGRSSESQLEPWASNPNDNPALYLVSVISAASEHLKPLYQSLAGDLLELKSTWGAEFDFGFGIASGPAGLDHMEGNGFRLLEGRNYRDHYPLMTIDAQSAATRFWQELLSNDTISMQRRALEQKAASLQFARAPVASEPARSPRLD